MAALIFRLLLLTLGLGAAEIGLSDALSGAALGWVLVLLIGLPLVVAGSAGFMAPAFGTAQGGRDEQ